MSSTLNLRTRALVVAGATALAVLGATSPAWADEAPMPGSAHDSVMSTGQAVLVFLGIPLLVVAVIYLLVAAPGWTRSGRVEAGDAWTGEQMSVGGGGPEAAVPAVPASLESAATSDEETGGTSASW